MGFIADDRFVRVDFFKPSGKWYATEHMEWVDGGYSDCLIHDAFKDSLIKSFNGRYSGMTAVCLNPHHEHSFPLMEIMK